MYPVPTYEANVIYDHIAYICTEEKHKCWRMYFRKFKGYTFVKRWIHTYINNMYHLLSSANHVDNFVVDMNNNSSIDVIVLSVSLQLPGASIHTALMIPFNQDVFLEYNRN